MTPPPLPLLAVATHGGAGNHTVSNDAKVKKALKIACGTSLTRLTSVAVDGAPSAVSNAICVLEDDPILNAGYGSNLNIDGNVECDAALMYGLDESFGSVAAVSGVKNPIQVACRLLEDSRVPSPSGLISPMILAANGAYSFASRNELSTLPVAELVSERAIREWDTWKKRIATHLLPPPSLDTVGAIALDAEGILAAGVSSGGLLLKHPGRVGQAAIFGAGCWASSPRRGAGVACSVSGEGERIIRASLARRICEAVMENMNEAELAIVKVMKRDLTPSSQAGAIVLVKEENDIHEFIPRLWCAFTTESMAVGYASSHVSPKARILRRPTGSTGVYLTSLPLVISGQTPLPGDTLSDTL